MSERRPFLFEIGTDELPARFLPVEREHLAGRLPALLDELGLGCSGLRILATPRRLAVLIDALDVRQADTVLELKGPPLSVAYGADGAPTPAAVGFARKNGLDVADCYEVADEKGGRFIGARKQVPGRPTAELLAERLPDLLLSIPFPKTMRWGSLELEYARPIQWLTALLGGDVVPVRLAGRTAGRETRGHRTLADNERIDVASPTDYVEALRKVHVLVDQDERRAVIEAGGAALALEAGGTLVPDPELLDEVVDLCEFPTPFLGGFSPDFFALPDEVLVTAMKSHQRYFSLRGPDGGLLPRFFAVRDGDGTALANVVHGNEKVLNARLADAHFYWDFDLRQGPDGHTARLADVTWLEGYGSVLDKVERVESLVRWLWEHGMGEGDPPAALLRAARICKFDLVIEMIRDGKEFTKLEGTIAARFAAAAGEAPAVCGIVEDYYSPRSAVDGLPGTAEAAALSVADRLDTLAGCWLAGFAPTGAKDPYALRRHTLAVLRILLDRGADLDLDAAVARALEPYADLADAAARTAAAAAIAGFIRTRLEGQLVAAGASGEAVRAVLRPHGHVPPRARAWAVALDGYRERADFQQLATGFKRCRNILEGRLLDEAGLAGCVERWLQGGRSPQGDGFASLPDAAEIRLRDAVAGAAPRLVAALDSGDREEALAILSALGPAIDAFFDAVRVNVADEALKSLRHAFLREVHGLFARVADLHEVAPLDSV